MSGYECHPSFVPLANFGCNPSQASFPAANAYRHASNAAAKGAVVTLGVAREFSGRGIRCLSISPASVDTAFQTASGASAEQAKRALDGIPMKRIATADEIGELVLFMCSDACQFMTADTVYVSGGGFR